MCEALIKGLEYKIFTLKSELNIPSNCQLYFECNNGTNNFYFLIKTFLYRLINSKCNTNASPFHVTLKVIDRISILIREIGLMFIRFEMISNKTSGCINNVYGTTSVETYHISVEMFCLLHLFGEVSFFKTGSNEFIVLKLNELKCKNAEMIPMVNNRLLLLNIINLKTFHTIDKTGLASIGIESYELYISRTKIEKSIELEIHVNNIIKYFDQFKLKFFENTHWRCIYYNYSSDNGSSNRQLIVDYMNKIENMNKHPMYTNSSDDIKMLYFTIYLISLSKLKSCNPNDNECKTSYCSQVNEMNMKITKFLKSKVNIDRRDRNNIQDVVLKNILLSDPSELIDIFEFNLNQMF